MSGHSAEHDSHELGHIIPYKVYVTVLAILLFLTVITVAASKVNFGSGSMNLIVAMLIASLKAGIVGAYFMHLKYENPLIWIYVAFPIILLFIMIGGLFLDNPTRIDPKIYYEHPKAAESADAAHH